MNYLVVFAFVTLIVVPYVRATISDYRLCADPECKVVLSKGRTSIRFRSIEHLVLSFEAGDEVTIYSKEAGMNKDLWGAEVRGVRGYVPRRLVREMQVFFRTPTYQVPTELVRLDSMEADFVPQQPPSPTPHLNMHPPPVLPDMVKLDELGNAKPELVNSPPDTNELTQHNSEMPDPAFPDSVGEAGTVSSGIVSEQVDPLQDLSVNGTGLEPLHLLSEEELMLETPIHSVFDTVDLPGSPVTPILTRSLDVEPIPVKVVEQFPSLQNPPATDSTPDHHHRSEAMPEETEQVNSTQSSPSVTDPIEPSSGNQVAGNIGEPLMDTVEETAAATPSDVGDVSSEQLIIDAGPINASGPAVGPEQTEQTNRVISSAGEDTNNLPVGDHDANLHDGLVKIDDGLNDGLAGRLYSIDDAGLSLEPVVSITDDVHAPDAPEVDGLLDKAFGWLGLSGAVGAVENEEVLSLAEQITALDPNRPDAVVAGEGDGAVGAEGSVQADDDLRVDSGDDHQATADLAAADDRQEQVVNLVVDASPEQQSSAVVDSSPEQESFGAVKALPEQEFSGAVEALPEQEPSVVVEALPEQESSAVVDALPEQEPSGAVEALPEKESSAVVDALPEQESSAVVDALPEQEPSGAVEALLEKESSAVVDALPEQEPSGVVEALPEQESSAVVEALPEQEPSGGDEVLSDQESSGVLGTMPEQELVEEAAPETNLPVQSEDTVVPEHPHDNSLHQHDHSDHQHDHSDDPADQVAPIGPPAIVAAPPAETPAQSDHSNHNHHHHHHPEDPKPSGCGHGHSHTPGYIPGFRHHYKPPKVVVEQPAPAPPSPSAAAPAPPSLPTVTPFNPPGVASSDLPGAAAPPSTSDDQASAPPAESGYISAEEIFAEMERKKKLENENAPESAEATDWLLASLFSNIPALHDAESGGGMSMVLILVAATATVLFLALHYSIDKSSRENALLAKISQLDAQLYEGQALTEEFGSSQAKMKQLDTEVTQLRKCNENLMAEVEDFHQQVDRLKSDNENLEKELESATESGLELSKMLDNVLASQGESNELQRSVEMLQQQLNKQQLMMESQNANLCSKSSENEALMLELVELQDSNEKYQVRLKSLQADLETVKTANRSYQLKIAQDEAELAKLKEGKDVWVAERRALAGQMAAVAKELADFKDKVDHHNAAIKLKDNEIQTLTQCLHRLKGTRSANDEASDGQLESLLEMEQLRGQLESANKATENLQHDYDLQLKKLDEISNEKILLESQFKQLQAVNQAAVREKLEAETRLEVLSSYFKEKEAQLQKELGTQEAKRAMTEENVSETVKKMLDTEESIGLYKSQVETLKKEIEEQERSYKSRLAVQEKRAHDSWVASRQLERRLEEAKQEAAQLRNRLIQVEKEKEAMLNTKENGMASNGASEELLKNCSKRPMVSSNAGNSEEVAALDHPSLLSPPVPPGMDLVHGPPPGLPFDPMFPPHFMPPAPFMPPDASMMPPMFMPPIPPPPSALMPDHRPPPLGMISAASFDMDFRRDMADGPPPPRRYPSPPRRYPSPLGSERSMNSDRSDLNHYEDPFRPMSPYGRHSGRPRSVGRSRDASPDRSRYSPLPAPMYPHGHAADDWDDSRAFRPHAMRSGSLRNNNQGPKTSSPLIHPVEIADRHRQLPH